MTAENLSPVSRCRLLQCSHQHLPTWCIFTVLKNTSRIQNNLGWLLCLYENSFIYICLWRSQTFWSAKKFLSTIFYDNNLVKPLFPTATWYERRLPQCTLLDVISWFSSRNYKSFVQARKKTSLLLVLKKGLSGEKENPGWIQKRRSRYWMLHLSTS